MIPLEEVMVSLGPKAPTISTKNISEKGDYIKYEKYQNENPNLKKFLDLNWYSLAIQSKLWKDKQSFKKFASKIDPINLNNKQRFLLNQPRIVLKLFLTLKSFTEKFGIRLSSFK